MSRAARTAPTRPSPITAVAIGTAQNVRALRQSNGSPNARPSSCPCPTSTWSSRCRPAIADIAYQNKAVVYDLLFRAAAETVLTIAADPKHLGARIGITAVLHTWGSTMTHHPHVHMIVPGGGISLDGSRWVSCRPRFLLPVPVFSKLFRGLMLAKLLAAHKAGQLKFFGQHAHLAERKAFAAYSGAAAQAQVVRLLKAPVRRTQGGARLSVALHPPRRHLQPPADCVRPQRRHLQVQGLSRRRPRAIQGHDPRNR